MAVSTYTDLKQACADWLNRADLEQQIPDFIKLAEATLNKVLRHTFMVANTNAALSGGKATLPGDALEILYAEVQSTPDSPLEQVTADQLLMLRRARLRSSGTPRFFAVIGREIWVTAIPASATTITLSYYQKIPTLSTTATTNWLLTDSPDIYLYTALMHAAPFLQDDQRMALFSNMVVQQVSASVQRDQRMAFSDIKEAGFSLKSASDKPAAPVLRAGGA